MSEEKSFTTHRTEDEAPGMSYTAEQLFQHRQIKLLESIDQKLDQMIRLNSTQLVNRNPRDGLEQLKPVLRRSGRERN